MMKCQSKNIFGLPEYVVAENDHQYPKYNADGSIKTKTTNVNFTAKNVIRVTEKGWILRKLRM